MGQSDVDRVRDATDLVQLVGEHIALRPRGREHVGLCPFHDDRSPSFAVVTHKGNAFYKCHACGAGGDVFDFVRNYHKLEFPEALKFLAERAGITLQPRTRRDSAGGAGGGDGGGNSGGDAQFTAAQLREANALAAAFFSKVLQSPSAGAVAREICQQRGISQEMIEAFNIGLAPDQWDALLNVIRKRNMSEAVFAAAGLLKARASDGQRSGGHYDTFRNRLIFPICNELGQPVAFGGRKIKPEDEPKYLNSPESAVFHKSRTLFGLHLAKRSIIDSRMAIITEGYTDVIAAHQAGLTNVVGTLGTALTNQHAKILSRLCDTVVLLFDGDEAGQRAADRALEVFFAEPVDVKVCVLPDGVDPDDLLKREGGADELRALVAGAVDALSHRVQRFSATLATLTGLSARQKAMEQFLRELADMGFGAMQGVRRRMVMSQLADMLGVSMRDIEQALPAPRRSAGPQHNDEAMAAQRDQAAMEQFEAVAPARRRAEHELLAIVMYEPSVCCTPASGAVRMNVEQFASVDTRQIAQVLLTRVQSGAACTMQSLLSELPSAAAKNLATSLYCDGQRICGETEADAAERFVEAMSALHAHMSREEYQQSVAAFRRSRQPGGEAIEAVRELLEQRRRQGLIPGAISSAART